jgi:hypothetical protein
MSNIVGTLLVDKKSLEDAFPDHLGKVHDGAVWF